MSHIRWATPTPAEVEKLRTLVRERFSVTLSEPEARELALRTLHLVQFFLYE